MNKNSLIPKIEDGQFALKAGYIHPGKPINTKEGREIHDAIMKARGEPVDIIISEEALKAFSEEDK